MYIISIIFSVENVLISPEYGIEYVVVIEAV